VLDFFCPEMMFAVEIDGGIHLDPEVAARDTERQRTLEERHIQFFRWTAAEVEKDPAAVVRQLAVSLGIIEQLLDQLPSPRPGRRGLNEDSPVMSATDAVALLDTLAAEGVGVWVTGGWGTDALVRGAKRGSIATSTCSSNVGTTTFEECPGC
jgi:hypothetical protein